MSVVEYTRNKPRLFEVLLEYRIQLLILVLAVIQAFYYWYGMPPSSDVDWIDFPRKFPLLILAFGIIVYVQKLKEEKLGYTLLIVGFSVFLFSQLENVMDMFRNISYPISGIDLEDFTSIALLLAGLGFWRWATFLVKTKEATAMHQRETELYAALLRHDLSNDLQALIGYVEAALMTSEEMPEKAEDFLKSATIAGKRMSRLVKTFASPVTYTEEDVVSLIRRICREAESAHKGMHITVTASSGIGNLNPHGTTLVIAALANLIRNTFEHTGDGPEMEIEIAREDGYVVLNVSDNGPGIPAELKPRLFERGLSESDKGLGLYLTRRLIEGLGGTIVLVDEPGTVGAKFRIALPLSS